MKTARMRVGLIALGLWLFVAGIASAADTTPPTITHVPVTQAVSDTGLTVTATVTDDVAVRRVVLYVRTAGTSNYYAIPMNVQGAERRATVPANLVTVGQLEYYIEATDTSGNIRTAPASDAALSPYAVDVVRDETVPEVVLRNPTGAIRGDNVVVVLLLQDEGRNIDTSSVRLLIDGRDVTSQANISASAITYIASAQEFSSISNIEVSVRDRAGNENVRRFRVFKTPDYSGRAEIGYVSADGNGRLTWRVQAQGAWGPFSANVLIDGADPMFTGVPGQPVNSYQLAYDSRILDVQVGDVTTNISPLTAQAAKHRGVNALLDLGILETTFASGLAVHPVVGESHARRFVGLRQELDLRFLTLGLNAVEVIDEETAGVAAEPQQNYIFTMDAGVGLFGAKAGVELGSALYFPSARGNLWEDVEKIADLGEPFDQIADMLSNVPAGVRRYLPFPGADSWLFSPPYIDLGGRATLSVPLPLAKVDAEYFYYGRDFRTMLGDAEADRQGIAASLTTQRLFDTVAFGARYKRYEDNVVSLFDMLSGSGPAGSQSAFVETAGEVNYRTRGGIVLGLKHEQKAANPDVATASLEADQDKTTTNTYGVDVRNIRTNFGGYAVNIAGALTQSTFNDLEDASNNKVTTTTKVTSRLSRGPWTYAAGLTHKREQDNNGDVVNSPTFTLGAGWSQRNVTLGGYNFDRVRVNADSSLSSSAGPGVQSNAATHNVRVRLNPSADTEISFQYRLKTSSTAAATSTWRIGYAINF